MGLDGLVAALALDLRLPWTFALATLAGAISGVGGYFCAYFFELPVGASQTVFSAALVLLALGTRALRNLVPRTA